MFGSSGIRGIANIEITPEFALKFGLSVGKIYKNVVIAHDPRIASEMIESSVISGLLASGSNVVKIGIVPTPTLAIYSKDYDCGIMITASHNPAEYIGMKLFKNGMSFDSREQKQIEEILKNERFSYANWDKIGNITQKNDAIELHLNQILKNTSNSNLKVVVDCGCGAASVITPYLLRKMGCKVITLNSQLDGYFPARNPEPIEDNLNVLKDTVLSCKADLGIAHDGDADRMMAIDNKGRFVNGDKLLIFFAIHEAKTSIAVPLDTTMVLDELLDGINIKKTKVGDVYVAQELRKINGEFGGEPSGAWIFPKISLCPDGIFAAAHIVEIIQKKGDFSNLIDEIQEYPMKRYSFTCSDKEKAMEKITDELKKLGDINILDGVRVDLPDGWILVRPSGTEPKIRITIESKQNIDKLSEKALKIIRSVL